MQFFRATCLATPFLQTLSHYETSCFTGVTLSNVSINLSRFDDHMRLKEQFHWLVPQTVTIQVAGQMLHCTIKKFDATVAESRTQFYVPQRFHQLVSQRFWPLQGMLPALGNDSCNLSRNGVARQVARKIAQCKNNRAARMARIFAHIFAVLCATTT